MKHLIVLFLLLFACAATASPPASADAEAARASDRAVKGGDEAARAGAEAARETADAQKLAELQTRMNDLAQRMADLSVKMSDQASASALRYLADSKRGMLGIALQDDSAGLRVTAVTPGGPAERAGIRDGDVITAVDDKPIDRGGDSLLADNMLAGQPVKLSVLRNGKTLQFHVTPERFQAQDWQALARTAQTAAQRSLEKFNSPEFRKQLDRSIEDAMKQSEKARAEIAAHWKDSDLDSRWFAPWWGLNLASLNPQLGGYFGTDRGALVLSNDAQRYPGLQAGDVITEMNGNAVTKPEDAMRALQSSPIDKPVRLTVLRHGKQFAVQLKTPPRGDLLPPLPPEPPAPTAPVAPKALPLPPPPPFPPAPSAPKQSI